MTRGIEFNVPAWAKAYVYAKCKADQECECEEEEEECQCFNGYVDMGHGDYWPCYLRVLFIAAYRKIQSEWTEEAAASGGDGAPPKPSKAAVLATILRVCPPSTEGIPLSAPQEYIREMRRKMGFGFGFGAGGGDEQASLHLKRCFEDDVQAVMAAAGLGALCDVCVNHELVNAIISPTLMPALAKVFTDLKPYFPRNKDHLVGTPYFFKDDKNLHYMYNFMKRDTLEELEEALAVAAELGCGITARVT